jgi:peptidoglycan-associated lipoprotein
VGAVVAMLAMVAGCAQPEVARPVVPASAPEPNGKPGTTSTTGAPVVRTETSHVNVAEDLARACQLHFSDVPQAPRFDFDQSELRADDDVVLEQIAKCLTTGPLRGRSIRLVGRADPRGEIEYNFALGGMRAAAVDGYLRALGVDPGRIEQTSRGKLDATGTDEASWERDRRVDIDLQ